MKFNNTELILDNFRECFKDYSLDIQDIVRSAILDGVDISKYILLCKDNPYRLEQIRLGIKEGLPSDLFSITEGKILYEIRKLSARKINISDIRRNIGKEGTLSNTSIEYLLKWVGEGVNISKLNLSIIPNQLLSTFDYGLQRGFDMSVFNTGISYDSKYIKLCLEIMGNGKPVELFLGGDWSLGVLRVLRKYSSMNMDVWNSLIDYIDCDISESRLLCLEKLTVKGVSIKDLQVKSNEGYVYSEGCIELVAYAYEHGLDYKTLIRKTHNCNEMGVLISEMELKKSKKVSGRIRKY